MRKTIVFNRQSLSQEVFIILTLKNFLTFLRTTLYCFHGDLQKDIPFCVNSIDTFFSSDFEILQTVQ